MKTAKELVTKLRESGLSQQQIADRCHVTQGAISNICTGRTQDVRASVYTQLLELVDERYNLNKRPQEKL